MSLPPERFVTDLVKQTFHNDGWVVPPEPSKMRLFVRVKGSSPFCLLADDNLLIEHYKEIATKYFKEKWVGVRQCPELVLVRCICFKNKDKLLDFKRKVKYLLSDRPPVPPVVTEGDDYVGEVYCESFNKETIRQNMVVTDPSTPPLIENCETELVIKNLSLDRLIIKITDPNTTEYVNEVFWDTYREFTQPQTVLHKLLERYEVPQIVRVGEAQRSPLDHNIHRVLKYKIQMRVVQLLENWVKTAYFDFTDDMYRTLLRWTANRIDRDSIPTNLLDLMKKNEHLRKALSSYTMPPPPNLSREDFDPILIRSPIRVLADFSETEIAEQLTLLTLHVHNHLLPCEFMGCKWLPGNGLGRNAPHFKAYRDLIHKVANWTVYAIVSQESFDTRVNVVKKLYLVCNELRQLSNWDMLVAVHGGISQLPSANLRSTHYHVEKQSELHPLVTELNDILSRNRTKILQEKMIAQPEQAQPVFPSLVIFLKQLEIIEEHLAEEEGQINFFRMSLEHNLIKYMLSAKGSKLPFKPIPKLQAVFTLYKLRDPQELIAMSHRCEPPDDEVGGGPGPGGLFE